MAGGLSVRNIVKGSEPNCLAAHRRTPHATYDNLPSDCKEELKRRMRREQGGLCCYCMSRVTTENGHIEHWRPQSSGSGALEYANLLLVCDGGGGALHCDKSKGDKSLKFNPANPQHDVESRIHYLANGKIEVQDDDEFNAQINDVLKLNAPYFVRARESVIAVTRKMARGQGMTALRKALRKNP